jgi:hypothetical protein
MSDPTTDGAPASNPATRRSYELENDTPGAQSVLEIESTDDEIVSGQSAILHDMLYKSNGRTMTIPRKDKMLKHTTM